jgi:pimeloyl-ACP methyl ester carboxylesterase
MKPKDLIVVSTLTLTIATVLYLINRYKTWKQQELARIRSESHVIETALGPVEYSTIGQGPAVLMAHGSPGGYDQGMAFSRLVDSPELTFIAVSRPGYLRTPLSTGKTPEEQADLYAALLDALAIRQAAIIGLSGGGPSAVRFALQHPDRCRGLVMICALAQRYSEKDIGQSLPPVVRFARQFADKVLLFDPALFLMELLSKWHPRTVALGEVFRTIAIHRLRKAGHDNDMQQFAAITAYPLERITVPTLVLHGTSDYTVSFAEAEFVASKVPHAKLVAVEGGDHAFYVTHKKQVVPILRAFLEAL